VRIDEFFSNNKYELLPPFAFQTDKYVLVPFAFYPTSMGFYDPNVNSYHQMSYFTSTHFFPQSF
jgi:hypothetical protein